LTQLRTIMNRSIYYIAFFWGFLLPLSLLAQDDWEKPAGGIEDAKVVIEKDKAITLRPVSRRFKAIQIEIPQAQPISMAYSFKSLLDSLPALQVIVRPRKMKDQQLEKFYGINAKLGYGNYNSPYALVNLSTKRSDEYMLAASFNHYSSARGPVLDDFSGAGVTNLGVSGKYFLNNITLFASANYKHQTYSIYGYDPAEITSQMIETSLLKQKLNILNFNIGLVDNNLKNNIDSDLRLGINYLSNNFNISEFIFDFNYDFTAHLGNAWAVSALANYTGFSLPNLAQMVVGKNRRVAQLKPVLSYNLSKLSLSLGVNLVHENDPINFGNRNHIFPVVGATYQLAVNHKIKALVDGQVEKVSLNSLFQQNPYLDSAVQANNNINNISGLLSLEGTLISNLGYKLSYNYKHYQRLMFFQNNIIDSARFDVIYDQGGATLNRISANLNYTFNKSLSVSANFAANTYTTVDIAEPWHRPAIELSFTSNFNIISNLSGHFTYFLLSGIKAQTIAGEVKTLAAVHDINFGLKLAVTERFGIFVDLMNILGSNYQLYNNYPVKGFQGIGGLSYKF